MTENVETIQKIYEKAYKEEYDNILIRDMEMRIATKMYEMNSEYLKSLGLVNIEDGNIYRGEISSTEYNEETKTNDPVKYKLCLVLKYPDIRINSNNPEFSFD